MLSFVMVLKLRGLVRAIFRDRVQRIIVLVKGRLEPCLSDLVSPSRRSLTVALPMAMQLAIAGRFRATALAPLSITARTPRVSLRSLVFPTKTLPLVFPLAFITTEAGAVKFRV